MSAPASEPKLRNGLPQIGRAVWETAGVREEYKTAATGPGWFDLGHWGCVHFDGKDAQDFLQRLSTLHFAKFEPQTARWGAFLNGRSGILALGIFDSFVSGYRMWLAPNQVAPTMEHIEKFHFAEQMQVRDASATWHLHAIWKAPVDLRFETPVQVWRDSVFSELTWVVVERPRAADLQTEFSVLKWPQFGEALFESYRIASGKGRLGIEIEIGDLFLTCGWDEAVDRNKGCYPGQEVVERIFTYGQVNKRLLPLEIEADSLPNPPFEFHDGETLAGRVHSFIPHPTDASRAIALGAVGRGAFEGTGFSGPGGSKISIRKLPVP